MISLRIPLLTALTIWSTIDARTVQHQENPLRDGKQITLTVGFEKRENSDPVLWPLLVSYALTKKNQTAKPGDMFYEILRIGECFSRICASCGTEHVSAKPFNIAMIAELGIEDTQSVSRPCMMLEDGDESGIQKITYAFTVHRDEYTLEQWHQIVDAVAASIVNFDLLKLSSIAELLHTT